MSFSVFDVIIRKVYCKPPNVKHHKSKLNFVRKKSSIIIHLVSICLNKVSVSVFVLSNKLNIQVEQVMVENFVFILTSYSLSKLKFAQHVIQHFRKISYIAKNAIS